MALDRSERQPVVEHARADVESGRLWKARDRLAGAIRTTPTDQDVLELLGEVHFRMGDHPTAWRFWVLTERSGPEAELAEAAFVERYGDEDLAAVLRRIPAREPLDDYPAAVQERLSGLEAKARDAGIAWPRSERDAMSEDGRLDDTPTGWLIGGVILVGFVGVWLVGLVVVIVFLAGLVL
jgi:hypothetical protein